MGHVAFVAKWSFVRDVLKDALIAGPSCKEGERISGYWRLAADERNTECDLNNFDYDDYGLGGYYLLKLHSCFDCSAQGFYHLFLRLLTAVDEDHNMEVSRAELAQHSTQLSDFCHPATSKLPSMLQSLASHALHRPVS